MCKPGLVLQRAAQLCSLNLPTIEGEKLEPAYRSELRGAYGIEFTSLLALNNMPIKRFADYLVEHLLICNKKARRLHMRNEQETASLSVALTANFPLLPPVFSPPQPLSVVSPGSGLLNLTRGS
eukprot:1158876-Pelagomonas_calceolata.AAC.8